MNLLVQIAPGAGRGTSNADTFVPMPDASYDQWVACNFSGTGGGATEYRPLGYWRLNDLGETTAYDHGPAGLNGTYSGTYTLDADGPIPLDGNGALSLTGSGHAAVAGTLTTTEFTAHLWFYGLKDSTERHLVNAKAGGDWEIYKDTSDHIQLNDGASTIKLVDASQWTASSWTSLVVTCDGTSTEAWINDGDGTQVQTVTAGAVLANRSTGAGLRIGIDEAGANGWSGRIAEVAIYNAAMNADAITPHASDRAKFVTITQWVASVDTSRGRSRVFDRFEAGGATIILENNAGHFTPEIASGRYYDATTSANELQTMKHIRVLCSSDDTAVQSRDTHYLTHTLYAEELSAQMWGYVERWDDKGGNKAPGTVRVDFVDATKAFAQDFVSATVSSATTDVMIGELCDAAQSTLPSYAAGWPTNRRSLATGISTPAALSIVDAPMLQEFQRLAETDGGAVYIDARGRLRFESRHTRSISFATSSGTFTTSPSAGQDGYVDVEWDYSDGQLYTVVRVDDFASGAPTTILGSDENLYRYGARRFDLPAIAETSAAEQEDRGNQFIRDFGELRRHVESITLHGRPTDFTVWKALLDSVADPQIGDISTRLTITFVNDAGQTISFDTHIEGIEHTITRSTWTTTYKLSNASQFTWWVLGDAILGVIGETTRVAF